MESTDRSEEDDDDELESSQGFQVLVDVLKLILSPLTAGSRILKNCVNFDLSFLILSFIDAITPRFIQNVLNMVAAVLGLWTDITLYQPGDPKPAEPGRPGWKRTRSSNRRHRSKAEGGS